jgi:hypothetical protein
LVLTPTGNTAEQKQGIQAHEDALFEHHQVMMEWYVAELARHFPGLAPAFMFNLSVAWFDGPVTAAA